MIKIRNILEAYDALDGIRGVIFDLDDTLYPEKAYVRSGYRKIAEAFPEIPDMADELWQAFEEGRRAIDYVLEAHGLATEENKAKALHIYRFQDPDIVLYPDVEVLLDRLERKTNKRIGILTDGRPEGQRAKLESLGLMGRIDTIVITDELGGIEYRKPNPAGFEKIQEMWGIPFAEMVYIGDNTKKDFKAPDKLGMKSIWFENPDGLYT